MYKLCYLVTIYYVFIHSCFQVAGIGHVNSFGLIYNDFMNDTKSTAKSLTTAHGVFAIMLAIGGIELFKYIVKSFVALVIVISILLSIVIPLILTILTVMHYSVVIANILM